MRRTERVYYRSRYRSHREGEPEAESDPRAEIIEVHPGAGLVNGNKLRLILSSRIRERHVTSDE